MGGGRGAGRRGGGLGRLGGGGVVRDSLEAWRLGNLWTKERRWRVVTLSEENEGPKKSRGREFRKSPE